MAPSEALNEITQIHSDIFHRNYYFQESGRENSVSTTRESETDSTNAELFLQLNHTVGILPLQIAQQALASTHHISETSTGMTILFVGPKMALQMFNTAAQNRNLHVSRTGILLVDTKFRNCLSFYFPIHLSFQRRNLKYPLGIGKRYYMIISPINRNYLTKSGLLNR